MQKNVSENSEQDPPRPLSTYPIPPHATCVFKGVVFDVYHWEQRMYDGTTETFEKLKRADTAGIIPVTIDKEILLIEEEQPGLAPFLTIPGGRVDQGEGTIAAAIRELREETGYAADELVLWESGQPSSKIDWVVYHFIGKRCRKISEMELDSGEKIKLHPVSFDAFIDIAINGKISDWQISERILRAKLYPEEMERIKTLLFG